MPRVIVAPLVERHPLYTATTYSWKGSPKLKTGLRDLLTVRDIVHAAEVDRDMLVTHDEADGTIRLTHTRPEPTLIVTFVPVAGLDHRTLTVPEATSLHLAEDWQYNTLHLSELVSVSAPAPRDEVREALVRAAERRETVALSGHVITLRNELGLPCGYLQPDYHPGAVLQRS